MVKRCPTLRAERAECIEAMLCDTKVDGVRTPEPRRGSWRVDAPILSQKRKTSHNDWLFGADYVSRQKRLSIVFDVANAQKQQVMTARPVLAVSTTMFQALEPENRHGSWRVDAPILSQKRKTSHNDWLFGADYGARTRHLHLGKVALYQMS